MKLEWRGWNLASRQLELGQHLLVLVEAVATPSDFSQRFVARTGKATVARTCIVRQHRLHPLFVVAPEHEKGEEA